MTAYEMRISDWSSDVCSSDLCWASLGARRLDQVLLPQSLTSLILAVDNDAEGERAAARATLRYARPGLEITRMAPSGVKDWAKVLEAAVEPLRCRRQAARGSCCISERMSVV